MTFIKIIFWISGFIIFWANIGYPLSMLIIGKVIHKKNKIDTKYEPTVTLMIVAHNEEKVIVERKGSVVTGSICSKI